MSIAVDTVGYDRNQLFEFWQAEVHREVDSGRLNRPPPANHPHYFPTIQPVSTMTNYVHPPNSKGLPYPGPVEFTQVHGVEMVTGYHAAYILEIFDERLRLIRSDGHQLCILTYHHVVAVALISEERDAISLGLDWVSAIALARTYIEKFDDGKLGPVEGKEEFRALQTKMN